MSETEQKLTNELPTEEETSEVATATKVPEVATEPAPVAVEAVERKKEPEKENYSYELIFLVDAGLPKEALDAIIEKVRTFVEREGGVVDNVRVSDVRRLSYEIKKRTHGIYIVVNFWLKPSLITELERLLRLEERVLRYMVIRTGE